MALITDVSAGVMDSEKNDRLGELEVVMDFENFDVKYLTKRTLER